MIRIPVLSPNDGQGGQLRDTCVGGGGHDGVGVVLGHVEVETHYRNGEVGGRRR